MIHAWGWPPDKVTDSRAAFPGLGVIHYPSTYAFAQAGDIAYVGNVQAARMAARTPEAWHLAIVGDEANLRQSPEAYNAFAAPILAILDAAGIPASTAAMGMVGGRFDAAWNAKIEGGSFRGVNCTPRQLGAAMRGIRAAGGRWVVTLIIARPNWLPLRYNTVLEWVAQQFYRPVAQLRRLQADEQVVAVGVWALHEGRLGTGEWQAWHGMLDRNDRVTIVGRQVRRALDP